jgi:glycosyltransferase involved in cell wall biosynthesis
VTAGPPARQTGSEVRHAGPGRSARLGFVSTRFAGTDGVSLETAKWTAVLERAGHQTFFFAGLLDRPDDRSRLVPHAFYRHPDIEAITRAAFASTLDVTAEADAEHPSVRRRPWFSPDVRPPHVTRRIDELKVELKDELYAFCRDFDLEVLVVENALAIPLNLPLGLALTELIAETGMPVIAHHHDLPWERQRFTVNSVGDIIAAAFPPPLPSVRHVVINSVQASQLAWRTGLSSRVIPNVMDFETPPAPPDDHAMTAREALGVPAGHAFILQATRIIARKGIEHAIELTRRLDVPAVLVITHASGDEGTDYEQRVRAFAQLLEVPVRFEADLVTPERQRTPDGRLSYSLADVYPHADLVTYPSTFEGFGNGFLEAVYFRRPIVVNRYSVYETDIRPHGFRAVEFDGYVNEATLRDARRLLAEPALVADWTERNYDLARRHFSFTVLEHRLGALLRECLGESA